MTRYLTFVITAYFVLHRALISGPVDLQRDCHQNYCISIHLSVCSWKLWNDVLSLVHNACMFEALRAPLSLSLNIFVPTWSHGSKTEKYCASKIVFFLLSVSLLTCGGDLICISSAWSPKATWNPTKDFSPSWFWSSLHFGFPRFPWSWAIALAASASGRMDSAISTLVTLNLKKMNCPSHKNFAVQEGRTLGRTLGGFAGKRELGCPISTQKRQGWF